MSKKIYICKTMEGSGTKQCAGSAEVTSNEWGDQAQDYYGEYAVNTPGLVRATINTRTYWEGTSLDASIKKSSRILAWDLQIENRNTSDVYQNDYYLEYFNTYGKDIIMTFPVSVTYMLNGYSSTEVLDVSFNGLALGSTYGNTARENITQQFNNLSTSNYPLYNISINTGKGPSIQSATNTALTTALAVEILKTTANFRPKLLIASLSEASTNKTIYSLTVPDVSREGKLYIKHFFLKDLAQQAHYTYYGIRNPISKIENFAEPPATVYNRSAAIEHSVYELYAGIDSYNLPIVNYRGDIPLMYSTTADTVSSSFDDDYIRAIKNYSGDGSTEPTLTEIGVTWEYFESIAWIDFVLFKFSFSSVVYSLGELIQLGVTIPTGISKIDVEIILPNLSSLINEATIAPQEGDYIGAFNPYNTFDLNIDFGYSSNNTSQSISKKEGIYYDTTKVRRMFVDKKEISYFVVDNDTTT